MNDNIVKADQSLRMKLIFFIILTGIAGIVIYKWGIPLLFKYLENFALEKSALIIEIILDLLILSFMPFAVYFFLIGRKILKYNRFPPPGMKVIRDAPIVQGSKARRRGVLLASVSIIFALILVVMVFQIHNIMQVLLKR